MNSSKFAQFAICALIFQQSLSFIINNLKNRTLLPTDFLRTHYQTSSKSPQKSIFSTFLPEDQCSILNYAEWHFLHFVHLGHFRKSLKCTKCTKCHMFFISPFSFHHSVFRFTKERLNTSIDTSKKNNHIKTHPANLPTCRVRGVNHFLWIVGISKLL